MTTYEVILSNGTVLDNLILNGNNFESKSEISESVFEDGLGVVTIVCHDVESGTTETVFDDMKLVALMPYEGGTRFILDVMSEDEIWKRSVLSNIDYMAMMADIEI